MVNLWSIIKKINAKIDFFYGGLFGALPILFGAGGLVCFTIPLCALLFAMGGDDDYASGWRDIGCSIANATALCLVTQNLLFFGSAAATFGLFTVGLGLPSVNPPDQGSPVGRLAFRLCGKREALANLATHAFLYATASLAYLAAHLLHGRL